MKAFGEIYLDATPIVVLGCGHFFTTETLDGLVGMAEVYAMDAHGLFVGLQDISGTLAPSVPRCPDCQRPIRQYATQRLNRVINRAVTDEMSKRFLTSGRASLQALEGQVSALELDFEKSRHELVKKFDAVGTATDPVRSVKVAEQLKSRDVESGKFAKAVAFFLESVAEKQQPVRKLHDATVKAIRASRPLNEQMEQLTMQGVLALSPDRRVILDGRAVHLKVQFLILADKLELLPKLASKLGDAAVIQFPGKSPVQLATAFFKSCEDLIADCDAANLTKLNVETCLQYSRIALLYQSYTFRTQSQDANKATDYVKRAKDLLASASKCALCPFTTPRSCAKPLERQ
ncbi:hypothetical protein MMC30_003703 [Trapelia coarctata]|nr:hypothetical protein [Trapelia coarctata]